MEQVRSERGPQTTDNYANKTSHYTTLAVVIIVGVFGGVFLRFVPEIIPSLDQMQSAFSMVSNVLLLITSIIAFRIVFGILGFSNKQD